MDKVAALIRNGQGDTVVNGFGFTHEAKVFWDQWGPASNATNSGLIGKIKVPILLIWGTEDALNTPETIANLKQKAISSPKVDAIIYPGANHSLYPVHAKVISDVLAWLTDLGYGPKPQVKEEVLTIMEGPMGRLDPKTDPFTGDIQRAVAYSSSANAAAKDTVVLMIHDWMSESINGPSAWLAPKLAAAGPLVVSINTQRGPIERINGNFETTDGYIKDWIDYFGGKGVKKVFLIGHGYGALRAAHYAATSGDKRIAGIVALAPTADPSALMTEALGADGYRRVVDAATAGAAQEKPDLTQFTASLTPLQNIRIVMWPKAFLASWGPDSPKVADELAHAKVPVLLIGGPGDPYLDKAGFDQLTTAVKDSKAIYYTDGPGADHEFHGFEDRVADDIAPWLKAH